MDHIMRYYVRLPKRALSMLIAVWIVETYCFDYFRYCGYLALKKSQMACCVNAGKG